MAVPKVPKPVIASFDAQKGIFKWKDRGDLSIEGGVCRSNLLTCAQTIEIVSLKNVRNDIHRGLLDSLRM
jgi:hypothetical protein